MSIVVNVWEIIFMYLRYMNRREIRNELICVPQSVWMIAGTLIKDTNHLVYHCFILVEQEFSTWLLIQIVASIWINCLSEHVFCILGCTFCRWSHCHTFTVIKRTTLSWYTVWNMQLIHKFNDKIFSKWTIFKTCTSLGFKIFMD